MSPTQADPTGAEAMATGDIDDCEPANFSPPLDSIQYREASEEVRTVLLSKRQCSRKCPGTSSGTMETCQAVHEQAWLPPVAHSAAAELEHAKSHGALQRCFLKLFRWQCVSTAVSNPARKAWQHLHMPKEQRARKSGQPKVFGPRYGDDLHKHWRY